MANAVGHGVAIDNGPLRIHHNEAGRQAAQHVQKQGSIGQQPGGRLRHDLSLTLKKPGTFCDTKTNPAR
jgi:hypothetical protein